jgi:3-hydroxy-9,10-secoandrosta-1,3,5(10)-triene-9,17-dione monooxygenase reductase component
MTTDAPLPSLAVLDPDPPAFRAAMSRVPTSVVVVAAIVGDTPVGMAVGTFTSISLAPLLVGYLGERSSVTSTRLLDAKTVSCSVLHESQLDLVEAFRREPDERFEGLDWKVHEQFAAPVLTGAPLVVFGEPAGTADAGDRVLALIRVRGLQTSGPARPLVFCEGRLARMDPAHLVDSDIWQLGLSATSGADWR